MLDLFLVVSTLSYLSVRRGNIEHSLSDDAISALAYKHEWENSLFPSACEVLGSVHSISLYRN